MSYTDFSLTVTDRFELVNLRRLIKGIIYLSSFIIFAFKMNMDFLYFGETIHFFNALLIFTIPYAVVGQYFLRNFQTDYNPVMETTWREHFIYTPSSPSKSSFNNINNVLEYRESMAHSMSSVNAAEMYANTGWIEAAAMRAENGSRMADSLGYVNSRLNSMSLSDGINFLSSGRA